MVDISMCADRTCPARGQCFRYLALPAKQQVYADYASLRAKNGGSCHSFVRVETWQVARGLVRRREVVDHENERAEKAETVS